ncbi:MAG: hypothetical protein EBV19_00275 [Flavobacteriia bacterium]|nr:hypothetical protein [Flavobacteriia bacterium]
MKSIKRNSIFALLLMGFIAFIPIGNVSGESSKTMNVLLVGNSQCPTIVAYQMLEKLAASDKGGIPIKVGGCIKGGASLKSHWDSGTAKGTARELIANGNWDFIVLQDIYNVQEPLFQPYARLFHDLIKKTGKQTILFGTASILTDFPKGFERQHRIHLNMGRELGVSIVDSSEAYIKYFGTDPTNEKMESSNIDIAPKIVVENVCHHLAAESEVADFSAKLQIATLLKAKLKIAGVVCFESINRGIGGNGNPFGSFDGWWPI